MQIEANINENLLPSGDIENQTAEIECLICYSNVAPQDATKLSGCDHMFC